MRTVKRFTVLSLSSVAMLMTACTPTTTTPSTAPLIVAPGYQNPADQQMGQILAGARSFYTSIQQQSASGALTLTPTEKQAFNAFGVSLNAADSIYLDYHNGQATQAAAQTAVNAVQTQQAALPLPGAK